MNKIQHFLYLLIFVFVSSCSTDVNVNDDWEDITIVYGFLSPKDSVHTIRVQRAYLGDGDVMEMAMVSDSIYYSDSLNVVLQKWKNGSQIGDDIPLTPVFVPKDEGEFASDGHYVYKTDLNEVIEIDDEATYKLIILNVDRDKEVTSQTEIVRDFIVTGPTTPFVNFNSTSDLTVSFDSPYYGKVYIPVIRFNYTEDGESKHADWILNSTTSNKTNGGDELNVKATRDNFFNFLKNNIEPSETKVRLVDSLALTFIVYAGSEEFHLYQQINGPSTGVVQEKPEFTNIENGIGIFSSRNYSTLNRMITSATLDSIICGVRTKNLHFGKIEPNLVTNQNDTLFCEN